MILISKLPALNNTVQLPIMAYVQYCTAASPHLSCQLTVTFGHLKWDCKETSGKRGQRRREKEIQEGLACIITLSRWHIYRLCQRGHAFCRSKRSEVWKSQLQHTGWPFNNYYHIPSTHYHDGDCDSARITTLSCHIGPKTALLCDVGDSTALKNQHNKGRQVKWKRRVGQREIWSKDESGGVRTIAPYSTLAVDVKHPSRSQWKAQQIRRWPVCIHYQSAHAPAPALNIRLPLMSA